MYACYMTAWLFQQRSLAKKIKILMLCINVFFRYNHPNQSIPLEKTVMRNEVLCYYVIMKSYMIFTVDFTPKCDIAREVLKFNIIACGEAPDISGCSSVFSLTHGSLGDEAEIFKFVIFKLTTRIDILRIFNELALRWMPQDLIGD